MTKRRMQNLSWLIQLRLVATKVVSEVEGVDGKGVEEQRVGGRIAEGEDVGEKRRAQHPFNYVASRIGQLLNLKERRNGMPFARTIAVHTNADTNATTAKQALKSWRIGNLLRNMIFQPSISSRVMFQPLKMYSGADI